MQASLRRRCRESGLQLVLVGGALSSYQRRCRHIKVPIRHHDHPARVHYCCVTGDRNLNRAVYTASNVADNDANTYIYYTFIILHYTVRISLFTCISTLHAQRALSLFSLPHFRGPLTTNQLGLRPQAPPRIGTRRRRAQVPF